MGDRYRVHDSWPCGSTRGQKKGEGGVTLIELIVALVVLGAAAAALASALPPLINTLTDDDEREPQTILNECAELVMTHGYDGANSGLPDGCSGDVSYGDNQPGLGECEGGLARLTLGYEPGDGSPSVVLCVDAD